jgi:molybdenum cofactor synthesis domain-containing protein
VNAFVLTISDRVSAGVREDASGPLAVELLTQAGLVVSSAVVSDDEPAITEALHDAVRNGIDVVVTTGGTGLAPRDVTPEATAAVVDRPAPGIAEAIRQAGKVPTAALSRGIAGVAGTTLIVNLAGSSGAVRDGLATLCPLLRHAVDQLHGGDH